MKNLKKIFTTIILLLLTVLCYGEQQTDNKSSVKTITINYPSGSKYVGEVNNKNEEHGYGTYICYNGSKYIGQFKNGKIFGQGTWYYANGKTISGQFRKNVIIDKKIDKKDSYGDTKLHISSKTGMI